MATEVLMNTWSERPMSVVGSYVILQSRLLVMIKSMQELSYPLLNVLHAGGPGCNPFRMVQPYCSHISISQRVLELVWVSSLSLLVLTSSSCGARLAILVFQSPHMTVVSCAGKHPTVSSIRLFAMFSSIPLLCWLIIGGKYIFPTHILSPPYIYMHTPYVYSLPMYFITFIPFLTNIAMPPRLPCFLRSSKT
jgi:hypothetical protein